ncbi:HIT family protein [Palaeococcus ferrophilus]|uniref:HIT family protein n=1 Tax=Palaeococcus ferrophilus TaxID=83868 RepID=UPI00064FCFD3|nr:HIT family protein [Palaeococcus ferrophilus]
MRCPFCRPDESAVLYYDEEIRILLDSYPANRGHVLVVPARHVERWEELEPGEKMALLHGVELTMGKLKEVLAPDGFNVGINLGDAAGQTVKHLHVHVIPRYKGDCGRPRGGVRKAVLDVEDENLNMRERWLKNRFGEDEVKMLKEAFAQNEKSDE